MNQHRQEREMPHKSTLLMSQQKLLIVWRLCRMGSRPVVAMVLPCLVLLRQLKLNWLRHLVPCDNRGRCYESRRWKSSFMRPTTSRLFGGTDWMVSLSS